MTICKHSWCCLWPVGRFFCCPVPLLLSDSAFHCTCVTASHSVTITLCHCQTLHGGLFHSVTAPRSATTTLFHSVTASHSGTTPLWHSCHCVTLCHHDTFGHCDTLGHCNTRCLPFCLHLLSHLLSLGPSMLSAASTSPSCLLYRTRLHCLAPVRLGCTARLLSSLFP